MLRLFSLLFLLQIVLLAKETESCYSVQLLSLPLNNENKKELTQQHFPTECKLMQISQILTVRCGCYSDVINAEDLLHKLQQSYKYAYVTSTYKYRFSGNTTNTKTTKKQKKGLITLEGLIGKEDIVKEKKSIAKEQQTPKEAIVKKKNSIAKKEIITKDEELKLMLQSFLYVNDLDNAYKVAQIGYKRNPHSYYWNQKMAEISRWTGRGTEAVLYMKYMDSQKPNQKLRNDIIDYGLDAYQYEEIEPLIVKKALKNPNNENINTMTFIHSEIGVPEKSAQILLEKYKQAPIQKNRFYLTKTLQIYLDTGDIDAAKDVVQRIEKLTPYTTKEAELIAYYYYLKHNIPKAYSTLTLADTTDTSPKYYELLSDLGWYLQKYTKAADASMSLYKMGKARLADYERITQIYKNKNLPLASKIAQQAYNEYQVSYIFHAYAREALLKQQYTDLSQRIQEFDQTDAGITKEPHYWLTKAELYARAQKKELAIDALHKALILSNNNLQIQLNIIYFCIEKDYTKKLRATLQRLSQNQNLSPHFYFPLATSYFYLQDINRAAYFLDKAKEAHLDVVHSTPYQFLEASLLQVRNNQNGFIQKLRAIQSKLKKQAKNSPLLLRQDNFLNNVLTIDMLLLPPDTFEKKLYDAKPYLSKQNYQSLEYNWAMQKNERELGNALYQNIEKKELWMRFNHALIQQSHPDIAEFLYAYLELLPFGDAIRTADIEGQIALAQSISYNTLMHNDDSENAYLQYLNLSKQRTDLFDAKLATYSRSPLLQDYTTLENKTYLGENYYLFAKLDYYFNKTLNNTALPMVPNETIETGFALQKVYNRGHTEIDIQYHKSMAAYFSLLLSEKYQFNHYYTLKGSLGKNINADESLQLTLAGKKDMLAIEFFWEIFPSTLLQSMYQHNIYSSQDNVAIGSGDFAKAELSYQFRSGYPDMRVTGFFATGIYNELEAKSPLKKSRTKGRIDLIQKPNQKALPQNFYNTGVGFAYGMLNSDIYTRVWRPYIQLSSYYNSYSSSLNYGFKAGYGGMVNEQDHLVFGASYSESTYGTGESIFEIFINYKLLYSSH